jgi:exonuclease 3'-5' domain-containing protein 1
VSLGREDGRLSIISLGTPNAEDIFLFDALTLSHEVLQPILMLFTDEKKCKYVWDGRMDYQQLIDSFGVRLCGAVDLQIVDVVSKGVRYGGEAEEERISRISSRSHVLSQVRQLQTSGVHGLLALRSSAPTEHGVLLDGITFTSELPFYSDSGFSFLLTPSDSAQT